MGAGFANTGRLNKPILRAIAGEEPAVHSARHHQRPGIHGNINIAFNMSRTNGEYYEHELPSNVITHGGKYRRTGRYSQRTGPYDTERTNQMSASPITQRH